MLSASECLLKAENYALAARLAPENQRLTLMVEAATWRALAFQIQMERFSPHVGLVEAVEEPPGPALDPPPRSH